MWPAHFAVAFWQEEGLAAEGALPAEGKGPANTDGDGHEAVLLMAGTSWRWAPKSEGARASSLLPSRTILPDTIHQFGEYSSSLRISGATFSYLGLPSLGPLHCLLDGMPGAGWADVWRGELVGGGCRCGVLVSAYVCVTC